MIYRICTATFVPFVQLSRLLLHGAGGSARSARRNATEENVHAV